MSCFHVYDTFECHFRQKNFCQIGMGHPVKLQFPSHAAITLCSNLTETKRKIAKAQTVHFCAQ